MFLLVVENPDGCIFEWFSGGRVRAVPVLRVNLEKPPTCERQMNVALNEGKPVGLYLFPDTISEFLLEYSKRLFDYLCY